MKAKKVYEFIQKKSLKQSINNNIGIIYKSKKEIIDWLNTYTDFKEFEHYNILDNLDVEFLSSIVILDDKRITDIPFNIIVNDLLLFDLPKLKNITGILKVKKELSIYDIILDSFPQIEGVTKLNLINTNLFKEIKNLNLHKLSLFQNKINTETINISKYLPENLIELRLDSIKSEIYFSKEQKINTVTIKSIKNQVLNLNNLNITYLKIEESVFSDWDISNTKLHSVIILNSVIKIPKGLKLNDLTIKKSTIIDKYIPEINVGSLSITNSEINDIDQNLKTNYFYYDKLTDNIIRKIKDKDILVKAK